jgi:hypothetical protein
MKQRNLSFGLPILLGCVFLLFTGCPSGLTDDAVDTAFSRSAIADPFEVELTLTGEDTSRYYDLATGEVVGEDDPWDFGVEYQAATSGLVFFYTNSEESVLGDGNIWFTDETDFDAVTVHTQAVTDFSDDYADYAPFVTDVRRYAQGMSYIEYDTLMNMMTYFGFPNDQVAGAGLDEDHPYEIIPYTPPTPLDKYIFYNFNKRAAYKDTGGMPPNFEPTYQVYIIKHQPDPSTAVPVYSKLQVTEFSLNSNDYSYSMTIQFTEVP